MHGLNTPFSTVATTASFSEARGYVLRLAADDGELVTNDDVTVTINAAPSVNIVYGDADEDGRFTIDDVHLVVECLIGQVPLPEAATAAWVAADVNGDGSIDSQDVALMISYLAGSIDQFPV